MSVDERKIQEIVEKVLARLGNAPARPGSTGTAAPAAPSGGGKKSLGIPAGRLGTYDTPDQAVEAARRGFEANEKAPLALRQKMIQAMRDVTRAHVKELARFAVEESSFGRYEDKLGKNLLVAEKTPGTEILRPVAYTGDDGLMLTERAPYGVILAVTPTTNPTETILCNGIGMLAGGNAVVFNVHPAASQTSTWHVHLLNEAIASVGGPKDCLVSIASRTASSAFAR